MTIFSVAFMSTDLQDIVESIDMWMEKGYKVHTFNSFQDVDVIRHSVLMTRCLHDVIE